MKKQTEKDTHQDKMQIEREFIYLLLNHKDIIEKWINSDLPIKAFSEENQFVLEEIIKAHKQGFLLTRKTYKEALKKIKVPKDRVAQELAFNFCRAAGTVKDDYIVLYNRLLEDNVQSSINVALDIFSKNIKEKNNRDALKQLVYDCNEILTESKEGNNDASYHQTMSKYKFFPVKSVPKIVREWAKMKTQVNNSHIEFNVLGPLAGLASLVQNKYQIYVHDKWFAYPSVSFIVVADSGENKTHPIMDGYAPLSRYQEKYAKEYNRQLDRYKAYSTSKNKKTWAGEEVKRPKRRPYKVNNFTIEGLRIAIKDGASFLIHTDELDNLFKSMNQYKGSGGNDMTALMGFLDGHSDDKEFAGDSSPGSKPARISLISTVQRDTIRGLYNKKTKQLGFAYRFLFSQPTEQSHFTINELSDDELIFKAEHDDKLERLYDIFHNIKKGCSIMEGEVPEEWTEPITVHFTTAAKKIFVDFNNNEVNELRYISKDDNGRVDKDISGVLSKIVSFTPKIALLFQLIKYYSDECDSLNVTENTILEAIDFMRYFMYHNYMVLQTTGAVTVDDIYSWMVNYIKKYDVQNMTIVVDELRRRKLKGYKKVSEIRAAVDILEQCEKALWLNNLKTKFKIL